MAGLVPVFHFKFKYLIVRVRRHENLQPVLMLFQYVPQVLDGFRLQENSGSNLKQDTSVRCHLKNKRLFLYLLNMVLGFIHKWNQVLKKDPNLFLNFFCHLLFINQVQSPISGYFPEDRLSEVTITVERYCIFIFPLQFCQKWFKANQFQFILDFVKIFFRVNFIKFLEIRKQSCRTRGPFVIGFNEMDEIVEVDLGEGVGELPLHRLVLPFEVSHGVLGEWFLSVRVKGS